MKWAQGLCRLKPGDVVYVEARRRPARTPGSSASRRRSRARSSRWTPIPAACSPWRAASPIAESEFNRATQAWRQPGSSFKPFVYSAALDNGYTPSSVIMDAPIEIRAGNEVWRPENYGGKFYGPATLRTGIEKSRNVMTVRLAQDMGMPLVAEYAKRFGIYDDLAPYLPMALGAGETTVLRLVTAYATIANGGRKINATLIDRIQDRFGRTIYQHDQRQCEGCDATSWTGQEEPTLVDNREQVLDPMTAYQITSMMEGVVKRGTATVVMQVGKPIAGKTGTTNDEKDAWFVGFSPDLVVGVFIGYDKPRPMGKGQTGGVLAAPIFTEFMKVALKDAPPKEFQVPPGLELIPIDRRTGLRAQGEGGDVILEAFKPGTAPPLTYSIIGYRDDPDTTWPTDTRRRRPLPRLETTARTALSMETGQRLLSKTRRSSPVQSSGMIARSEIGSSDWRKGPIARCREVCCRARRRDLSGTAERRDAAKDRARSPA